MKTPIFDQNILARLVLAIFIIIELAALDRVFADDRQANENYGETGTPAHAGQSLTTSLKDFVKSNATAFPHQEIDGLIWDSVSRQGHSLHFRLLDSKYSRDQVDITLTETLLSASLHQRVCYERSQLYYFLQDGAKIVVDYFDRDSSHITSWPIDLRFCTGMSALHSAGEKTGNSSERPGQAQVAAASRNKTGETALSAKMRSIQLIKNTQFYLQQLGYDPGPADGIPGKRTIAAIRQAQQELKLAVDGKASPGLLNSLRTRLPNPDSPVRSVRNREGKYLNQAETTIYLIQKELERLGYLFDPPEGELDFHTESAIKRFQKAHGLPQTGKTDETTLTNLRKFIR